MRQQSLKKTIMLKGVGLHSGLESELKIHPAAENFGIVFKRVDMPQAALVKGLYTNVVDTGNCTCLSNADKAVVSTIEHLMAALSVRGIDNALIEVNNPELPIMDGSGKMFYDALKAAEIETQNAERKQLKVLKKVSFTDDKGNTASLEPADEFSVHMEIDFPSKIVGHQVFDAPITPEIFATEIAPCRTFCEKYQVDYLRSIGLIKGGSLDNAIVLDGDTLLNPDGFRVKEECVKHKVLDVIGDLYTSGYQITGRFEGIKTGHYHNNELLKVLFSDKSNYEIK